MNGSQLSTLGRNNPSKYKTMLCKHHSSPKGCSFGDKCQFAHGYQELRNQSGQLNPMMQIPLQKKGPNPQNYKIVKCKYWEKDGTCRYGTLCSFAHGDNELRTKSENMQMQNGGINQFGLESNPYMMGFNPNVMMGMPNLLNFPSGANIMNNPFMNMPMSMENMGMAENNFGFPMNQPGNQQQKQQMFQNPEMEDKDEDK